MKNLFQYVVNIIKDNANVFNGKSVADISSEIKDDDGVVIGIKFDWKYSHLLDRGAITDLLSDSLWSVAPPKPYQNDMNEANDLKQTYVPSVVLWKQEDRSTADSADGWNAYE
tara:strand:- start:6241 stop:6579 length:339 start_codon:yes stop_codon:yes gene_type:complete